MALELDNILITGSSGFIGSALTKYFSEKNIGFIPFSWDLLVVDSIRNFFQNNPWITQIVHLVWAFEGDFDRLMQLNFDTTKNLLKIATEFGIRKVIFTSTGAVYGEPQWDESSEEDERRPNTWYGLSKKLSEDILEYYIQNLNITGIILRFPNVYGAWSRGVISNFQKNILENKKITIYGNGSQSRNFLHISDAILAIDVACKYPKSDIFNITNPVKVSLNDLAKFFHARHEFEIEYVSQNDNKLNNLLLSSRKAKEILGFEALQKTLLID